MNQTLIKLSETHYIVVDGSRIHPSEKSVKVYVDKLIGTTLVVCDNNVCEVDLGWTTTQLKTGCRRITHSTQPLEGNHTENVCWDCRGKITDKGVCFCNNEVKNISLSEVEEAIYGYSVEKMAENYSKEGCWPGVRKKSYIEGFNAHKELVKDKLFTVEDMKKAISLAWNYGQKSENNLTDSMDVIIQSLLPPTEWKVTFDEQGKLKLI